MPNYGDYRNDVPFNHGAADSLLRALRDIISELSGNQGPGRTQISSTVLQYWEGPYRYQFDDRTQICIDDVQPFVRALNEAVRQLEHLKTEAQREQIRRLECRAGEQR
jgi:hypothetical protein